MNHSGKTGDPKENKSKFSGIMWALICNNVVSFSLFLILMIFDLCYQFLIVLVLFSEADCFAQDISFIEKYLSLNNGNLNNTLVQTYVVFGMLLFMVVFLLISNFRENNVKNRSENLIFSKICSIILSLLRSILFTLMVQILANSYNLYGFLDSIVHKIVITIIVGCSIVFLILLQLISSILYTLPVPNSIIPWSESSSQPFVLECAHKALLMIAFASRSEKALFHAFIALTLTLTSYKFLLRTRKSFHFNSTVQTLCKATDILMIHLLLFLQIGYAIKDPQFFTLSLIIIPITLSSTMFFIMKYRQWKYIDQFETSKNDNDRFQSYTNLLYQLTSGKLDSQAALNQIQRQHILECSQFKKSMEKQMKDSSKERSELVQTMPDNKTVKVNPNSNHKFKGNNENTHQVLNTGGVQYQTKDTDITFITDDSSFSQLNQGYKVGTQNSTLTKSRSLTKKRISNFKSPSTFDLGEQSRTAITNIATPSHSHPSRQPISNVNSKMHLKTLKHLFKHHLITDKTKDHRLQLLKIYFTVKILKNPYLAHFLLLEYIEHSKLENIIVIYQKYLVMRYIDSLISVKQNEEYNSLNIDIQNILDFNKMILKLDSSLIEVADAVTEFWEHLLNEKDSFQIYEQGLLVAQGLNQVEETYQLIETTRGDKKECKLYLQMAAFYKYVVFKKNEYEHELQKSRNAIQNNKIVKNQTEQHLTNEKGLIISKLNTKSQMEIDFINKPGCQLIQYDEDKILGKSINSIMPHIIAENHQNFMDRFLISGKHLMLNSKKSMFIKQKSGYLIPVHTYLFVNYLNKRNMILIFEPNEDFKPFQNSPLQTAFFVVDKYLTVHELSKSCLEVCKLSYQLLTKYENQITRKVQLDDLFEINKLSDQLQMLSSDDFDDCEQTAISKYDSYVEQIGDYDHDYEEEKSEDI